MTHDSGDDVAEGMTVGVIAEESRYMAETPSDVGVGDTLHVSVVDGELAASVNSPIEGWRGYFEPDSGRYSGR